MLINTLLSLLRGYHVDLGTVAAQVISILFVILCILPLHELAHAWVANKLGDPTAKLEGRLTFNPLASVDPMGALALLLFGFGWAGFQPAGRLRRGGLSGGYGGVLPL